MHNKEIFSDLTASDKTDIDEFIKKVTKKYPSFCINYATCREGKHTNNFDNKSIGMDEALQKVENAVAIGDYNIAERLLIELTEIYPDNNEILYNLALIKRIKKNEMN